MAWSSRPILLPQEPVESNKSTSVNHSLHWECAKSGGGVSELTRPGSLCVCERERTSVEAEMEQRRLVWLTPEKPHSSSPQLCETHEPQFFFPKRKLWEAQRVDASVTGTQLVRIGTFWPHDVLLWGLCFSCGAQEEKERGKVPFLTTTAGDVI